MVPLWVGGGGLAAEFKIPWRWVKDSKLWKFSMLTSGFLSGVLCSGERLSVVYYV
jgi:hypothetical protein